MERRDPDYLKFAQRFEIEGSPIRYNKVSGGLINLTIEIITSETSYILQNINSHVFKKPVHLMHNIDIVAEHLKHKNYPKQILKPIKTHQEKKLFVDLEGRHWRMYPMVKDTIWFNRVDDPQMAYEVATAFGEYVCYLKDLNPNRLHITLPDFHNTPIRYQNFLKAVKNGLRGYVKMATPLFDQIDAWADQLLKRYPELAKPVSVVHNDTKITNLLFDKVTKKPTCVIDLDTLMPGVLAYEFGDIVRTCAPTFDEDHCNVEEVAIRWDIFEALLKAYQESTKDHFFHVDRSYLETGVALTIFEQGLRFLTEYLRNTNYYNQDHRVDNLYRAKNQFALLEDFLKKKNKF